jgi:uncharacterized membrane protein
MNSRLKLILFGIGLLVVLVVSVAAVKLPPDGVERGEFTQFVGRFHPLVVHFPIALVLLAAVLECASLLKNTKHLQANAGFVLALAAASAIVAVSLGWMLGRSGGYEGALVTRHMWGGISLAAVLLACCAIRAWNPRLYAASLFATVCLMAWTSDQGGRLTHGEGFLTEHMPGKLRSLLGVVPPKPRSQTKSLPVEDVSAAPVTTPASVAFFASRIEPVFDDKCVQCHGPEKKKGKLRLDTFEYVMRGGKDGPVIKPGDAKNSELYRRVTLPRDNKDAMPAEGKPGLTGAELKVIEYWIASGATQNVTVAASNAAPPPPAKPIVVALTSDYRPRASEIAALEARLGVLLIPRSQNPRDGLILRTVSAPARFDDTALSGLQPIADLVVDAELARTKITDQGIKTLSGFANMRSLDLSRTLVTSGGLAPLAKLSKLESLNLTETNVDDQGVLPLRRKQLRHLYLFGTKCSDSEGQKIETKQSDR